MKEIETDVLLKEKLIVVEKCLLTNWLNENKLFPMYWFLSTVKSNKLNRRSISKAPHPILFRLNHGFPDSCVARECIDYEWEEKKNKYECSKKPGHEQSKWGTKNYELRNFFDFSTLHRYSRMTNRWLRKEDWTETVTHDRCCKVLFPIFRCNHIVQLLWIQSLI